MLNLTKTIEEFATDLEDLIRRRDEHKLIELKKALIGSGGVRNLLPVLYRRGRQALVRNDLLVGSDLLFWLEELDPGNWQAHLAASEARELTNGIDHANGIFFAHLEKYPIYRYQNSSSKNNIRCGIFLTKGSGCTRFKAGGFTLPNGLTESQHLFQGEDFSAAMIFVDGRSAWEELAEFDVLLNAISDPDIYSPQLEYLESLANKTGRFMINGPSASLANDRSLPYRRLGRERDVIIPKIFRVALGGSPDVVLKRCIADMGMRFPLLIRPAGTQTGEGLMKIYSIADFPRNVKSGSYYISEFHDFRSADGYYRKYRFWCIGGKIVHNHVLIGDWWNVHGSVRFSLMAQKEAFIKEDRDYVECGLPAQNRNLESLAYKLMSSTGLDYFGVDYGINHDGIPIVFEVNATMRSNYPEMEGIFPHSSIALRNHVAAFHGLVRKISPPHNGG